MDSILDTVKQVNGIPITDTSFDEEIILHTNSVFMALNQMGVGPATCFIITGKDEIWTDFLGTETKLEAVKSYIGLKVRTIFDPPTSTSVLESFNRILGEYEWRLNNQAEEGLYLIPEEVVEDDG